MVLDEGVFALAGGIDVLLTAGGDGGSYRRGLRAAGEDLSGAGAWKSLKIGWEFGPINPGSECREL